MRLQLVHRVLPGAVDARAAYTRLLADLPCAFWLDSSRLQDELAHVSIMGAGEGPLAEVLRYRAGSGVVEVERDGVGHHEHGTILDALQRRLDHLSVDPPPDLPVDLCGGWVGAFGYELGADLGLAAGGRSAHPDAVWTGADRLVVVDHRQARTHLVALHDGSPDDAARAGRWLRRVTRAVSDLPPGDRSEPDVAPPPGDVPTHLLARDRGRYLADVDAVRKALHDGDSYEVCLTNTLHVPAQVDPVALHHRLRTGNPAPYGGLLRFPGLALVASSPERFLRVTRDGTAESRPIKGTVARSSDPAADLAAARALAADPKCHAENLMIVDLLRNDLSRVCVPGSVVVPTLMGVESYATVHHLVSTVRGRLDDGQDAVSCLTALFPGGSMTGAPKPRTMEIIAELERAPRGLYSGAFGYLGLRGPTGTAPADLAMTIRSAVVDADGVSIGGGGAVVADSDPQTEWEEMLHKVAAVWRPLADLAARVQAGHP